MSGTGPEVQNQTKDLRRPQSLLFISFKKGHTSDIRSTTLSSYLNKLSYLVINKQINSLGPGPSQSLTLGPLQPLRPFTLGYRWTKSCKLSKAQTFLSKRPYLVRQQQQYVSGTNSSPRPFPSACSSSGRKKGGAYPLQPSLQESILGSRYWLPLQMFTVRSLIFLTV